ncbi:hypothetical protein [Actinoplanes auranticolor]|uniref:Uncharacterized protein n=1 Tax=Actinoplanes auranticolor TaxID=47988 RepID=A0A919S4V1_9ACTN|nr:hypothetical protein [Actinoplanes auranticolor]GIM64002.1 hypothetical protein Aau02nite_07740 [Actinoplanes auranticolor]
MAGRIAWVSIVATAFGVWLVCGLAIWHDWIDGPTASFIGSSAAVSLLLLEKLGVRRRLVGDRSPVSPPSDPHHSDT